MPEEQSYFDIYMVDCDMIKPLEFKIDYFELWFSKSWSTKVIFLTILFSCGV